MPPVRLSKSAERWLLRKIADLAAVNPVAARAYPEVRNAEDFALLFS